MITFRSIAQILATDTSSVSDLRNPRYWLLEGAATESASGEQVNPEIALSLSAYYGCLKVLSEDCAKLPLKVYKRLDRGKEPLHGNEYYRMLHDSPNDDMTSIIFRETITSHAAGWGNGYSEIKRDGFRRPEYLSPPIHPSRVTVGRNDNGRVEYTIRDEKGTQRKVDRDDMLHIHGMGNNGIHGYSVCHVAVESIGLSIAAQKFGSRFFGHGAVPTGVLSHPAELKDTAKDDLREAWQANYGGSSPRTAILEEGMKYERMGIPPEEAQFLETRQFQVEEICRWFRMPPHKIMHLARATFSNIEHQSLEYVVDTLMPWLVRWEQEFKRKLFKDSDMFAEHVISALLRGDMDARGKFHTALWSVGAKSINEIRDDENMNPIDGGDTYFVPLNMVRIEDLDKQQEQMEKDTRPNVTDNTTPEGKLHEIYDGNPVEAPLGAVGKVMGAMYPLFQDAASQIMRKEYNAAMKAGKKFNRKTNIPGFIEWLSGFYGNEHKEYIMRVFSAPSFALAEMMNMTDWDGSQLVDSHISQSREMLEKCFNTGNIEDDFGKYTESKIEELARSVMGEVSNGNLTE